MISPHHISRWKQAGIVVFVILCGLPAVELNGFGFGIPLTLTTALLCATVGGLLGGVMICPRPFLAGLVGGLLAGPVGLVAVYYYTQNRQHIWDGELVLIQGLASLPGLAVGLLIKKILRGYAPPTDPADPPAHQ